MAAAGSRATVAGFCRSVPSRGGEAPDPGAGVGSMKVDGVVRRSIQVTADGRSVEIVDQTLLPHRFVTRELRNLSQPPPKRLARCSVRGAPLIGATAAYGVASPDARGAFGRLVDSAQSKRCSRRGRPPSTCAGRSMKCAPHCMDIPPAAREERAYARAAEICEEDVENCRTIGEHGFALDRGPARAAGRAGSAERPDTLQRRLARDRRLGDGARTRLSRPRSGNPDSRLGRRDPSEESGSESHGLGTRPTRCAAYRDCRQRGRSPDAARPGGSVHHGLRPDDVDRRRLQQDRHLL